MKDGRAVTSPSQTLALRILQSPSLTGRWSPKLHLLREDLILWKIKTTLHLGLLVASIGNRLFPAMIEQKPATGLRSFQARVSFAVLLRLSRNMLKKKTLSQRKNTHKIHKSKWRAWTSQLFKQEWEQVPLMEDTKSTSLIKEMKNKKMIMMMKMMISFLSLAQHSLKMKHLHYKSKWKREKTFPNLENLKSFYHLYQLFLKA
jgi:hypothetical protein